MLNGSERQRIDNAFSDFRCGLIGSVKLEGALREVHSLYELKITTQANQITNLEAETLALKQKVEEYSGRLAHASNEAVYAERHRP